MSGNLHRRYAFDRLIPSGDDAAVLKQVIQHLNTFSERMNGLALDISRTQPQATQQTVVTPATGGGVVSPIVNVLTTAPLEGGGLLDVDRTLAITGLSSLGTANYVVGVNAGATGWEYKQLIAGTNITITHAANSVTFDVTGAGGNHNLLSATHPDTTPASVVRGDIITGQTGPVWARLALGASGRILTSDGTDAAWAVNTPAWANITGIPATFPATAHALLSATHSDTTVGTVARGDVITGQGVSPTWTRLAIGASGRILTSDGTDASWAVNTPAWGDITGVPATFPATAHNLLSATHADAATQTVVLGDLIFGQFVSPGVARWERLAGNITTTQKVLAQTGTGAASDAPFWVAITHTLLDGAGAYHTDTVASSPVLGGMIYANNTPAWQQLAGNTTAAKMYLTQTGTGAVSAAPAWAAIADADVPATIVRTSRTISTTVPLTGGGDLSANRTFALAGLSTYGTANQLVGTNSGATGWEYKPLTVTSTGNAVLTQSAQTSGTPKVLTLVGGAHTALTGGVEVLDVDMTGLNRTVLRFSGAVALQRTVAIGAATYAFTGTSNITLGATLWIEGPPGLSGGTASQRYAEYIANGGLYVVNTSFNRGSVSNEGFVVDQTINHSSATAASHIAVDIIDSCTQSGSSANVSHDGFTTSISYTNGGLANSAYSRGHSMYWSGTLSGAVTVAECSNGYFVMNYVGTPTTTTVTNSYGLYVSTAISTTKITNHYGVYLTMSGTGTTTTQWAFYSASTTVSNYFGYQVGIGVAPTALLHLATNGTIGHIRMDGIAGNPASPTPGDVWYNTTQKSLRFRETAGTCGAVGLLYTNTANSSAISNTVSETNFSTSYSLPANSLTAGKVLRIQVWGTFGNVAGHTINIRFKLGSTTIVATGAITISAANTTRGFHFEGQITCRTTGATGTVIGNSHITLDNEYGQVSTNNGTATIDTTASQTVQVSIQWGTASATDTITAEQFSVQVMD